MDLVARELGKDPAEIRKINFIKPEQFPYKSAAGAVYDTGNYAPTLEKAMDIIGYQQLRAEQAQKRAEGKLMGIGVSSYIEICGFGPKGSAPVGLYESARVRVEQSGTVMVYTGSSPHGQGEETSFAQIVAEEFSNRFEVLYRAPRPDYSMSHLLRRASTSSWGRVPFVRGSSTPRRTLSST